MSRLIDADELLKEFNPNGEPIDPITVRMRIVQAPTIFDVDKVIKELKLLQENARLERKRKIIANEEVEELCDCDDWYDDGYTTGYLNAQINTYQEIIEIIKANRKED